GERVTFFNLLNAFCIVLVFRLKLLSAGFQLLAGGIELVLLCGKLFLGCCLGDASCDGMSYSGIELLLSGIKVLFRGSEVGFGLIKLFGRVLQLFLGIS